MPGGGASARTTGGATTTGPDATHPPNYLSKLRQRILVSHTPLCHRRMVITTQFSVLPCCTAAQTSSVPLQVAWGGGGGSGGGGPAGGRAGQFSLETLVGG